MLELLATLAGVVVGLVLAVLAFFVLGAWFEVDLDPKGVGLT